jgi:hypothetical protein
MLGLQPDEEITIGRNNNSNVVMKEISVSRTHCSLIYKHRKLFIQDKSSKFGTLVRVLNETDFSANQGLWLQLESKLIQIQNNSSLGCCCAENDNYILRVCSEIKHTAEVKWDGESNALLQIDQLI